MTCQLARRSAASQGVSPVRVGTRSLLAEDRNWQRPYEHSKNYEHEEPQHARDRLKSLTTRPAPKQIVRDGNESQRDYCHVQQRRSTIGAQGTIGPIPPEDK